MTPNRISGARYHSVMTCTLGIHNQNSVDSKAEQRILRPTIIKNFRIVPTTALDNCTLVTTCHSLPKAPHRSRSCGHLKNKHLVSVLPDGYAKCAREPKISQLHGVGGAVDQQILGLHVAMQDAVAEQRQHRSKPGRKLL